MAKTKTITLDKPLVGHNGPITRIVLREPTFEEYLEHGDPFTIGLAPESRIPFVIEDKPTIAAYARLLVVEPDALILQQGGLAVARALKDGVLSFFRDASEADGGSKISPTNSPLSSEPTRSDSST